MATKMPKKTTKTDLLKKAKKHKIKNYSSMTKDELTKAIAKAGDKKHKIMNNSTTVTNKKIVAKKNAAQPTKPKAPKKLSSPTYQELVGESKYYVGAETTHLNQESDYDFPKTYNENKIVALIKDPYWLHLYWDLDQNELNQIKNNSAQLLLRVLDITNTTPEHPNFSFEIEIPITNNWYVNIPNPNATYCVDLGYKTTNNNFKNITRSNSVTTPISSISNASVAGKKSASIDIENNDDFSISKEDFEKIYALSGGLGIQENNLSSAALRKKVAEQLQQGLSSGALSSLVSSQFSQDKKGLAKEKDFFLIVNTELILYGITVPSAKLTIQGRQKKLKPDGTFSARFALPNGKQIIPVRSTSADEDDEITITPIVEKVTE